MKRRATILVVLVFLLVLGFAILLPHASHRRALEAFKQQLRDRGEKLTLAELALPPATNAGLASNLFAGLSNFSAGPLSPPAMMLYIAPGVAKAGHRESNPAAIPGYDVNTNRAAQLRALLLDAPELNFNADYSNGAWRVYQRLTQLDTAGRLLAGTAVQALAARDEAGSCADLSAAVALLRLFKDEHYLSGFGRAWMARSLISSTWEVLQSDLWTDRQWSELQSKWQELDLFAAEQVMTLERVASLDQIALEIKGVPATVALVKSAITVNRGPRNDPGFFSDFPLKLKRLYDIGPGYWKWKAYGADEEELYALQLYEAALAASRRVRSTGAFAPALNEFRRQATNINQAHAEGGKSFRFIENPDRAGAVGGSLLRLAQVETARRMTVTAIALKRFQLQHHAYPASLSELVPAFLAQVPADFMDGQPLRYKLQPDGSFLLYSVGDDGEDNGGDPSPKANTKNWLSGRDIVWPRAATPREVEDYLNRPPGSTNAPGR